MRQPSRKVGETYTCYEEKFIIYHHLQTYDAQATSCYEWAVTTPHQTYRVIVTC